MAKKYLELLWNDAACPECIESIDTGVLEVGALTALSGDEVCVITPETAEVDTCALCDAHLRPGAYQLVNVYRIASF
ncbi:hypothetical protein [Glutamicibacter creatinolyticus]|uniref:hypothetical protein n=1 Tax=Glutamicibacter creatinolyticus TaxID=162496 RepID=UPI0032179243